MKREKGPVSWRLHSSKGKQSINKLMCEMVLSAMKRNKARMWAGASGLELIVVVF